MLTTLARRPRLFNALHCIGAVQARTQMTQGERAALRRWATGRRVALEIGTFMGVSACDIATAMGRMGLLTCVDPWAGYEGNDPCLSIARREFARRGVEHCIHIERGTSAEVAERLRSYDFIFIDGDHSEDGLAIDWQITRDHLLRDGIVCLHDTVGTLGSARYFDRTIARDRDYTLLERVESMSVLGRH